MDEKKSRETKLSRRMPGAQNPGLLGKFGPAGLYHESLLSSLGFHQGPVPEGPGNGMKDDGAGGKFTDGSSNYTVVKGDTLWDIAARFHTSVEALMKRNNLQKTDICPGQILAIPKSQKPEDKDKKDKELKTGDAQNASNKGPVTNPVATVAQKNSGDSLKPAYALPKIDLQQIQFDIEQSKKAEEQRAKKQYDLVHGPIKMDIASMGYTPVDQIANVAGTEMREKRRIAEEPSPGMETLREFVQVNAELGLDAIGEKYFIAKNPNGLLEMLPKRGATFSPKGNKATYYMLSKDYKAVTLKYTVDKELTHEMSELGHKVKNGNLVLDVVFLLPNLGDWLNEKDPAKKEELKWELIKSAVMGAISYLAPEVGLTLTGLELAAQLTMGTEEWNRDMYEYWKDRAEKYQYEYPEGDRAAQERDKYYHLLHPDEPELHPEFRQAY